jgi:hypothetical protein
VPSARDLRMTAGHGKIGASLLSRRVVAGRKAELLLAFVLAACGGKTDLPGGNWADAGASDGAPAGAGGTSGTAGKAGSSGRGGAGVGGSSGRGGTAGLGGVSGSAGRGGSASGGTGGSGLCGPEPRCNWCGGVPVTDSLGCTIGYRCANGVDPCMTPPCKRTRDCPEHAFCGVEGLCLSSPLSCEVSCTDDSGCLCKYSCSHGLTFDHACRVDAAAGELYCRCIARNMAYECKLSGLSRNFCGYALSCCAEYF